MRVCPKCISNKILTKIITERRINAKYIDCKYKDKMGTNV